MADAARVLHHTDCTDAVDASLRLHIAKPAAESPFSRTSPTTAHPCIVRQLLPRAERQRRAEALARAWDALKDRAPKKWSDERVAREMGMARQDVAKLRTGADPLTDLRVASLPAVLRAAYEVERVEMVQLSLFAERR
jgi:hypothetical protein